ncbi:hypothetical protein NOK12_10250 [Nocardioides sp. OK12]|uniref:fibronectin type III domain-containing protein n=1 Tax=Nocardioides sp. OK12 TaxID=2758661 RepID=UPI0021C3626C|nr:fibronectin type III domain-containing protein [Nocardioides sp. OK12]GHJ58506.1 hypothetical protein NOK12_10250 [Nocardioides sp. OK12]
MTVETPARATATRRPSALAALIGIATATALTLTGVGAVPAAHAAPAVAATGVLVEADGAPVTDGRVRYRGDSSTTFSTDDQGRFTVPLNSDQTVALDFVYPMPDGHSTLIVHGSAMPPVTESIDLGAVTMPPLTDHQIRVVDVDGAPVHRAYLLGSSNRLSGYDWQDLGANLTASGDMVIADATFASARNSDPAGLLSVSGPRIATPDLPINVAHHDRSVARLAQTWNPNGDLGDDRVWTVPLNDFRIGAPMEPWVPELDIVDKNTIRVTPRAGAYDGGSAITGYDIVATPTEGASTTVSMDATQTSTEVTGLSTGIEHGVYVRARNAAGTSALSQGGHRIVPAGPPSRIKRPVATVGSKPRTKRDTGNVILKWKTPNDNGARLAWFYVSANGEKPTRVHHSRNRLRTKARVGRHKYTITAINMRGFSKPSKPVTVRVRLRR